MRRIKRTAALLFAAFLAFAPPGTLIFAAVLLLGFVRSKLVLAACAACAALPVVWLLLRRRARRAVDSPAEEKRPADG